MVHYRLLLYRLLIEIKSLGDIPVLGGAAEFDPKNRIQVLTIGTQTAINLFGYLKTKFILKCRSRQRKSSL